MFNIQVLDEVLSQWEDRAILGKLSSKVMHQASRGRIEEIKDANNTADLRKFLLRLHQKKNFNSVTRFMPKIDGDLPNVMPLVPITPYLLAAWNNFSRRVFSISKEIQALLQATDLDGVRWKDIDFPFESFAVSFEKPLARLFHTCLVAPSINWKLNNQREGYTFAFFLAPSGYRRLGHAFADKVNRYLKNKEVDRAINLVHGGTASSVYREANQEYCFTFSPDSPDDLLTDIVSTIRPQHEELIRFVQNIKAEEDDEGISEEDLEKAKNMTELVEESSRVIFGLALYLKTLPSSGDNAVSWRAVPRLGAPDPNAITNELHVCSVNSVYNLTKEERIYLGLDQSDEEALLLHEKSWHFRRGHWRRPPGQGNDPTAKKSVHVRPALVRQDRMPKDEGLPGGAFQSL